MENRFERLYGYAQRSLVKSIRKELGEDESITMGILLFHSFSESFYYESTVKSTLLFPEQIKTQFKENEIWNYELMFYLAKYMSKPITKSYIRDLINDNDRLVRKDASFFSILFDDYLQFKQTWLDWIDKELHFSKDDNFNEMQKPALNNLFYFANYLLTIIKYTAYTTSFNPETGAFRENIYRVVIGDVKNNNTGKIERTSGELQPKNDYEWNRSLDSQLNYSELALVLEICFKQPFSINDKIDDIQSIEKGGNSKKEMVFCSMAKPLKYNGEFQGIIYVTKNSNKGIFTDEDFVKFINAIHSFHFESIIYLSRFDTARFLLENITEMDQNINPLLKILNCQHLFSSSPLGLIILPETGSFIRYRETDFMQTRKIDLPIGKIFSLITKILNINIIDLLNESNYHWIDIDNENENKFGRSLNKLLSINEDLFIKSFTCMKYIERGEDCYYLLFNSNHLNKYSNSVNQSFALRTHNNISKLIDIILSNKRIFDVQHNLMNEFQLNFFHDEKNFIINQKQKIISAQNETTKEKIVNSLGKIINYFDVAENHYTDFVKLLREQFDERLKSKVSKATIENIFNMVKEDVNDKKIKFALELRITNDDYIETYEESLKSVIKQIVMNAVTQYGMYSYKKLKNKKIHLIVDKINDASRQIEGFSFKIHNTGTKIPELIIKIAGDERVHNGSNNSSGMGFIILKNLLKRMKASRFGSKYFQIVNETKAKGVSVRFSLPHKTSKS